MRTRDGKPLEVNARVQLFWALLLATVLLMQLALPFRLGGALPCLAAIWIAVTVLVRLARGRRIGLLLRKRTWPVGVGLGLGFVLALSFASDAALYPIVADREECVAGANTQAAEQQCLAETEDRMNEWAQSLFGGLGATG